MELEFLRREARLTLPKTLEILNISPRTWTRWKRSGGPPWARRLLKYEAGYLDALGWERWQIRAGELYCNDLHHSYKWSPGDLIADLVMPKNTKKEGSERLSDPRPSEPEMVKGGLIREGKRAELRLIEQPRARLRRAN